MKLYNSLTKKLEPLKSQSGKVVSIYSCGPTVYDRAHIGNLRTYIFEDTLRRALILSGYRLSHVMNITDVDDKTIARSAQRYPKLEPLAALAKLTRHYEKIFLADMDRLGIDLSHTKVIRATDEIPAMEELIKKIEHRYIGDDGVYFSIDNYPDYGVLVKLDRRHKHHRINNDEYDKDHVADFALWKVAKPGEPSWTLEFDGHKIVGRPGWHIECAAISAKYLGQPFDIHTGGVDLMFPHHENELAQARSAQGKDLAKVFLHAHHLLVDGKKMSKSLKNFYTLDSLLAKDIDPLAFRLLCLQANYRHQLNFTWKSLAAAAIRLKKYRDFALRRWQSVAPQAGVVPPITQSAVDELLSSLQSDLDTPSMLAKFDKYIDRVQNEDLSNPLWRVQEYLDFIDQALGLQLLQQKDISLSQKSMISEREIARQTGNWQKGDKLRDKLVKAGIELNDTPGGTIWSRAS